jgi:alcohol dehydrogenase class IV
LPAVVDFNAPVVEAKLAEAARALGAEPSSQGLAAWLCELRRSIGLPQSLGAAGVKPDQLDRLADGAIADACHRGNPRPCAREDLLSLYQASL